MQNGCYKYLNKYVEIAFKIEPFSFYLFKSSDFILFRSEISLGKISG